VKGDPDVVARDRVGVRDRQHREGDQAGEQGCFAESSQNYLQKILYSSVVRTLEGRISASNWSAKDR
jgi:hypothetical protein